MKFEYISTIRSREAVRHERVYNLPPENPIQHENFLPMYRQTLSFETDDLLPPVYYSLVVGATFYMYRVREIKEKGMKRAQFFILSGDCSVQIDLSTTRPLLTLQFPEDADISTCGIKKRGKNYIITVGRKGKGDGLVAKLDAIRRLFM